MEKKKVSEAVIRRLPRYYRYLQELKAEGITRISSNKLSERMGYTASQIRHDFNCFGGFGQQGYGYNVADLCKEIGNIIGAGRKYNVIVVGAGNIGQALARYEGFRTEGFEVCALFDADEAIIGRNVSGLPVFSMQQLPEYCKAHNIHIAAICVPKQFAANVAKTVMDSGVQAIWNFAPVDLFLPSVTIENVSLSDSLFVLAYRMNETNP